ncbi:MAG: ECF-type sigma factor [Bryobacteraceae bacterium]
MPPTDPADITSLLTDWSEGDEEAGRKLIEAVYRELKRLAAMNLHREFNAITLQPTALVNELCVRMLSGPPVSCENRLHFLHLASRQMRRLIVDHARRKKGLKRGGSQPLLSLDEARDHAVALDEGVADVNEALTRLEELDSRTAAVVEMRFFGGLTEQEIADVLGISTATVKRDWEFARAWLLAQLRAAPQD